MFDLLPSEMSTLHAVGRLDMATTGLLILTNDTRLSSYLTDPANAILRTYIVTVSGEITEAELAKARAGILDNGELLRPAGLTLRKASGRESHLTVELVEGKNREIRRIFEALGHEVVRLKRIAYGALQLGALEPGQFRRLTMEEFNLPAALFSKAGHSEAKECPAPEASPALSRNPRPGRDFSPKCGIKKQASSRPWEREKKRFKRKPPPGRRHF